MYPVHTLQYVTSTVEAELQGEAEAEIVVPAVRRVVVSVRHATVPGVVVPAAAAVHAVRALAGTFLLRVVYTSSDQSPSTYSTSTAQ